MCDAVGLTRILTCRQYVGLTVLVAQLSPVTPDSFATVDNESSRLQP